MLLDRIGPPAEVPRVNLLCHPYAREGQAVVCPLLRGSSPTRGVAPKQHRTRRLLTNRPCSSLVYEESDSKERLRVSKPGGRRRPHFVRWSRDVNPSSHPYTARARFFLILLSLRGAGD